MTTSDSIAALYREVYQHPDDDHVRRVLADALMAIGDPRGELIQLQLDPTSDHDRRAMRLIQQYGLTWLGPLRDIVIPLGYERGFLASCRITARLVDALDHAEWSTVHTIELGKVSGFRIDPGMRSLRTVVAPRAIGAELRVRHSAQVASQNIKFRVGGD